MIWLEEPLGRYKWDSLARLATATDLPIAGGENNVFLHEFRGLIDGRCYDVVQPDALVCGGMSVLRKVAAYAEMHHLPIAPHHGGNGLGVATHLHLSASLPNAPWIELLQDPPALEVDEFQGLLAAPLAPGADGYVRVPEGPGLGVALLVALVAVPAVTRADFPLDRFVRFGKVDVTERLPPEEQVPIRHVAPSDPDVRRPSFQPVAPAELPLGLVRVEQSTPDADRVEVLYRNDAGVAIMVVQIPITAGAVTLDSPGVDRAVVRDTEVVITRDTRPDAVASLMWERGDVIFDVMVIEAPIGPYGGFKQADALQAVEALMEAQDAGQE